MNKRTSNLPTIQLPPCDVCRSTQGRFLYQAKDRLRLTAEVFHIVECSGCRVLRTSPHLKEELLSRYYPQEYWGGVPTERWIQKSQADKTDFIRACRLSGGEILDVGCGAGFFLRALDEKRWRRSGVEIGCEAARAAARALPEESIFQGTLQEAAFADETFDVVTFWSSLEHTNEPRANLLEARRILKPGGTLIIQVPNAASYQIKVFRGDWFALDAPRHRYHFTPQSLKMVVTETGFSIYQTTFQSRSHNPHALRQSLKAKLWNRSPFHQTAFLLAIPFLKPFDFLMSTGEKGATMTVAAHAV